MQKEHEKQTDQFSLYWMQYMYYMPCPCPATKCNKWNGIPGLPGDDM